jgi:hypothetical protein
MAGCRVQPLATRFIAQSVSQSVPWWDRVWFGDLLVVASVVVAVLIFWQTQRASRRRQRESTLAHLRGVKVAMEAWADDFFGTSYAGDDAARNRSEIDFNAVMQGSYFQNFRVPTEPVASLSQPPGEAWPIAARTIETASVALLRFTVFNQLVQQQTDFNVLHAEELQHPDIDDGQTRHPIALAARRISETIHHDAIGDATWYVDFIKALDANILELELMLRLNRFVPPFTEAHAMPRPPSPLLRLRPGTRRP